jgi:hypothetical protein
MMIARSLIVISLLLLWSPASAETIDQLKSIVASNICPRDLKTYSLLSYNPTCDSLKETREVLQCQDRINAENAVIEKYDMFVINCRISRDSLDGSQRLGPAQSSAGSTSQPCADAANSCEKTCFHIFGPDGEQKPGAVQACNASCGNQLNQCLFEGKNLPNASAAIDSGDTTLHREAVASQSPTAEKKPKTPELSKEDQNKESPPLGPQVGERERPQEAAPPQRPAGDIYQYCKAEMMKIWPRGEFCYTGSPQNCGISGYKECVHGDPNWRQSVH